MEPILSPVIIDTLAGLRKELPKIAQLLALPEQGLLEDWKSILDRKLLPRMQPDSPLVAAICGGGSSGKSTLFNTLAGKTLSPTGGRAGINRRVLIAVHQSHLHQNNFLDALYEPFGCPPKKLNATEELTLNGDPLHVTSDKIPQNLVLLDTPDFDTGAKGVYANRELARNSLETADILIYIFTNSNYNNRDNTDFLGRIIAGIGQRKCVLVYRVYPDFSNEEVLEHAATVAKNIYKDNAAKSILGIYRADNENAVAAGDKFMTLTPVGDTQYPLMGTLTRIDPRLERIELFTSMVKDVVRDADSIAAQLDTAARALALYLDAVQAAQSHCVRDALSHFPMDQVAKRFAQIWLATDPAHIKVMRKTGRIMEIPFTAIASLVKRFKKSSKNSQAKGKNLTFSNRFEMDLLDAANKLYKHLVNPELTVTLLQNDPVAKRMQEALAHLTDQQVLKFNYGRYEKSDNGFCHFTITAHPALKTARRALKERNWRQALDRITSQKESILSLSQPMETELCNLAGQFRSRMKLTARLQQTLVAFLNVLPATVAVSYILATGDPVGGVGIKVKLAGLFGLSDLYALVAIPVTAGVKQADLNQLKKLLAPIAQAWLNSKLSAVQTLFETQISAVVTINAAQNLKEARNLLTQTRDRIAVCARSLEG